MSDDKEPKFSSDPLSAQELQQVRAVLEKEARWKWLAVTARNTAAYVAVIIGGLTVFWDALARLLKGLK